MPPCTTSCTGAFTSPMRPPSQASIIGWAKVSLASEGCPKGIGMPARPGQETAKARIDGRAASALAGRRSYSPLEGARARSPRRNALVARLGIARQAQRLSRSPAQYPAKPRKRSIRFENAIDDITFGHIQASRTPRRSHSQSKTSQIATVRDSQLQPYWGRIPPRARRTSEAREGSDARQGSVRQAFG